MGMVLGGSLFCLRLLVIVNSVYLLLRSLDLITEMPDMQITEAMFLISLFHLFSRPEGNREKAEPTFCINGGEKCCIDMQKKQGIEKKDHV